MRWLFLIVLCGCATTPAPVAQVPKRAAKAPIKHGCGMNIRIVDNGTERALAESEFYVACPGHFTYKGVVYKLKIEDYRTRSLVYAPVSSVR